MPACFQLYPIGSDQPAVLQKVDDEMRQHFGCPANPDKFLGWYQYIGLLLAMGWTYERLIQDIDGHCLCAKPGEHWACDMRDMLTYLMDRYTTNAFYSPK